MKTKLFVVLFLGLVFIVGQTACSRHHSKDDQTIGVGENDVEMNAAIAKARSSLSDFWEIYERREHGESDFSLKVKIHDEDKVEHFWIIGLKRKDGKIFGVINNDPDIVQNVKLGEKIEVNEADISDWLYMRDGKMVGNYTLRVLFKQMPKEEVEKYKRMLADP